MPIPIHFPQPTEAVLANYDYVDIAEGTGSVRYYMIQYQTSAGTTYGLTRQADRSANISTSPGGTVEYDLDLPAFNLPKLVRGTAIFGASGDKGNGTLNFTVTLKKWDGTTETNITSAITSDDGGVGEDWFIFELPVTTDTHFKIGEILRLTVSVVGTGTAKWNHDPSDSEGANPSKAGFISVPFKIDL